MKNFVIHQDGAGNYEVGAASAAAAIRKMAMAIVENTENWQIQFSTRSKKEAIEKASKSLSIKELSNG